MLIEEYEYWLVNLNQIGIKKIDLLLQTFHTAGQIYYATKAELQSFKDTIGSGTKFSDADIETILNSRNPEKIHKDYTKLERNGIYFVSRRNQAYPKKLINIYDPPQGLYVKGRLPKEQEKVLAIIGARECSAYGREMAKYFAAEMAKEGISIISGLARGIDSYAHEGALVSGGRTYAVLGCGIDTCYPKENLNLYLELQKEGAVISEYAPGIKPLAGNFPMRNRIISGMSDGIFVIEAREKSGSLITVDMGLEQGKNIYVLPGRIIDRLSCGCNNLLKMGAKLVTSPKDILEDLIPNYIQNKKEMKKNNIFLETNGKIVYACLSLEPIHIEEIALKTGLSFDLIMEQLLLFELQGLARQTMKNYYIVQN